MWELQLDRFLVWHEVCESRMIGLVRILQAELGKGDPTLGWSTSTVGGKVDEKTGEEEEERMRRGGEGGRRYWTCLRGTAVICQDPQAAR